MANTLTNILMVTLKMNHSEGEVLLTYIASLCTRNLVSFYLVNTQIAQERDIAVGNHASLLDASKRREKREERREKREERREKREEGRGKREERREKREERREMFHLTAPIRELG